MWAHSKKPSCVSFHSNIIIKTISLRKIIPRNFFRCLCVYFSLFYCCMPYLSTIIQFSFFFEVKLFFSGQHESEEKKTFSARLKNDDTNLGCYWTQLMCGVSRRFEHLLSVTKAINILTLLALSGGFSR
jgi:hypothetical protein